MDKIIVDEETYDAILAGAIALEIGEWQRDQEYARIIHQFLDRLDWE